MERALLLIFCIISIVVYIIEAGDLRFCIALLVNILLWDYDANVLRTEQRNMLIFSRSKDNGAYMYMHVRENPSNCSCENV